MDGWGVSSRKGRGANVLMRCQNQCFLCSFGGKYLQNVVFCPIQMTFFPHDQNTSYAPKWAIILLKESFCLYRPIHLHQQGLCELNNRIEPLWAINLTVIRPQMTPHTFGCINAVSITTRLSPKMYSQDAHNMHKMDLAWLSSWILACLLGSSSEPAASIIKIVVSNDGQSLILRKNVTSSIFTKMWLSLFVILTPSITFDQFMS